MAPALETSLKSLSLSSDVNTQVFKLLELNQFSEALRIARSPKAGSVSKLYVAYAQYRTGQEEKCLETLADAKDRASRHLRAQALYRLEKIAPSEIDDLKSNTEVTAEAADLSVNQAAIAAQHAALGMADINFPAEPQDPSHEFLFNKSIFLSHTGRVESAIETLHKAIQTLELLQLAPEDHDAELAPIQAQLAHLNNDVAMNASAKSKESDSSTRFLSSINFKEAEQNPYALHKAYHAQAMLKPSARLFSFQDRFVSYDRIVAMNSIGLSIKKATNRYISRYSGVDPERCASLRHLLFSRYTKQSLQELITKEPNNAEAVAALVAKTVTQGRGVSRSIKILEAVPSETMNQSPGLIGLWCALHDLTDHSNSHEILSSAIQSARGSERVELLTGFIQRYLSQKKQGDPSEVSKYLSELQRLDPGNKIGQAAVLVLHPSEADDVILDLPDLSSIDVHALEMNTKRKLEDDSAYRPSVKKQKVKSAEQLAAESKLDPERWLPKRDRSHFKPNRKEKLKGKGGHQGGLVDESLMTQGPSNTTKSGEVARKKKNKKGKK